MTLKEQMELVRKRKPHLSPAQVMRRAKWILRLRKTSVTLLSLGTSRAISKLM